MMSQRRKKGGYVRRRDGLASSLRVVTGGVCTSVGTLVVLASLLQGQAAAAIARGGKIREPLIVTPTMKPDVASRGGNRSIRSLTIDITALPPGTKAHVTVRGAAATRLIRRTTTLKRVPAGNYSIAAQALRTRSATYYPIIAACASPSRCPSLPGGRITLTRRSSTTVFVVYADVVPDSTKVLSGPVLKRLEGGLSPSGMLVFRGTAPLPVGRGSVLVAPPSSRLPYGLLRKVVSITKQHHATVLATAPATLVDAVTRGAFDIAERARRSNVAHAGRAHSSNAPITNYSLSLPRSPISCGGSTQIEGAANLPEPQFNFSAGWGTDSSPTVSLTATVEATASASLFAKNGAGCAWSAEFPPNPDPGYLLPTITVIVGDVPIWVTPELMGTLSVSGAVTGETDVSARASASVTAGVKYEHGAFEPVFAATHSAGATSSTPGQGGKIQIATGPKLYFDFYDNRLFACDVLLHCEDAVASPYVDLTFGPTLTIQPLLEPIWRVDGGVNFAVGLDISEIGLDVGEEFPLAQFPLIAPPGRPRAVTAIAGNGTATVSWQPPEADPAPAEPCACQPVTGYTVYVGGRAAAMTTGATTAIVSGLSGGQTYQVTVAADSSVGEGGQSSPVSVTPASSPPPSGWTAPIKIDSVALESISCASESFCVAVDGMGNAVVYKGGAWSKPESIAGTHWLRAVSCPSVSFCMVLAAPSEAVLYNGTAWETPSKFALTPGIDALSCGSPSLCAAAGEESLDLEGEVLTYKAGSWSAPIGKLGGANEGEWRVSCASDGFCLAVSASGTTETFSGSSWVKASSKPGADIGAVSCTSESFCGAVAYQGRALTFNGTAWSSSGTLYSPSPLLNAISCAREHFCVAVSAKDAYVFNGTSWETRSNVDPNEEGFLRSVSCPTERFCAAVDFEGNVVTTTEP